MPKRISWKKGMRLTDEVLNAADRCSEETIRQAFALASAGRIGLMPSPRPFQLSLSIGKGYVEIESIDCLGVTRAGDIVDIRFGTNFTNSFDTRLPIPTHGDDKEFLLTVNADADAWKDTADGFKEPDYTFALVGQKTAIPDHALPIARIVNEDGWQEDTSYFVPPCLFVSAHAKYVELLEKLLDILKSINERTMQQLNTAVRPAISIYWPVVQQVFIEANTCRETLTPMQLQSFVQRVVGIFTCACEFDEILNLEDADMFRNYASIPYNPRVSYQRIRQGLGMCYAIGEKIEKFSLLKIEEPVAPPPPPKPEPPKDDRRRWSGPNI